MAARVVSSRHRSSLLHLNETPRAAPVRRLRRAVVLAALAAAVGPVAWPRGAAAQSGEPAGPAAVAPAGMVRRGIEGRLSKPALVFSGAGTNYYPTMRLKAGDTVLVIEAKKGWLKIVPPEGSFSYVPKAFVNAHGDGRTGRVSRQCLVKAGSGMQTDKSTPQVKLEPDETVTILGEDNEYYKIKPPPGAFLYIDEAAVPAPSTARNGNGGGNGAGRPPVAEPPPAPPTGDNPPARPVPPLPEPPPEPIVTTPPPTTRDATASSGTPAPAAPSTQPGAADLLTQLQKLETDFADMSKRPLLEQPIAEMLEQYEQLAAAPQLPAMAKRIADVRVTTLRVRSEAKGQFADVQKRQQELQERQKVQQAERDEIQQRIKQIDVQVYAAVGTLRTSSLQVSRTPLYRLTDPESGRTVVYVWGTDPKVGELIGQFVGVKGPMQTDARLNLKVVTPTATDAVDPAKVHGNVVAEVVPPSLMPKPGTQAGTASTGNQ